MATPNHIGVLERPTVAFQAVVPAQPAITVRYVTPAPPPAPPEARQPTQPVYPVAFTEELHGELERLFYDWLLAHAPADVINAYEAVTLLPQYHDDLRCCRHIDDDNRQLVREVVEHGMFAREALRVKVGG